MVVHGHYALDELTITTASTVYGLRDGELERYELAPTELGFALAAPDTVPGGDPAANARLAHELLQGAEGPVRDVVLLNAAAGLVVAGVVDTFGEAVGLARQSIDDGAAKVALDTLVSVSTSLAG